MVGKYSVLGDSIQRQSLSTHEDQPVKTITLPYIQEALCRILLNLDIRVAFRPHSTLRQLLVRPKDPIPPDSRKGVVYKIRCKDCSQSYVHRADRENVIVPFKGTQASHVSG